jgi:hypothetical protein
MLLHLLRRHVGVIVPSAVVLAHMLQAEIAPVAQALRASRRWISTSLPAALPLAGAGSFFGKGRRVTDGGGLAWLYRSFNLERCSVLAKLRPLEIPGCGKT